MRAIFGVVGLLVALAIVGMLAVKQLKATGQSIADVRPAGAGAASGPQSGTVREQSRQLQQRVQSDVTRALEQGAAARKDEPGQ